MQMKRRGWWALVGMILASLVALLTLYVRTYYALVYPVHGGAVGIGSGNIQMVFPKINARYSRVFGIEPLGFFAPMHAIDTRLRPAFWQAGPPYPLSKPPPHRPFRPDSRTQSN
jgi:hypothetical protein